MKSYLTDNRWRAPARSYLGVSTYCPLQPGPFSRDKAYRFLWTPEHWHLTIEAIGKSEHKVVGLLLTRGDEAESAQPEDFHRVGTVGRVRALVGVQDLRHAVDLDGLFRACAENLRYIDL